ncbi:MAG: M23 family metallopeptidase [Desulfobacterales bacterium]
MIDIVLVTLIGQVFLPLALLTWLWRGQCRSRIEWLFKTVAVVTYQALSAVVGIGLLMPWYSAFGLAALSIPASVAAWRRTVPEAHRFMGLRPLFRRWPLPLLAVSCLACLAWALMGYVPPPGQTVSAVFPLKSGVFHVVNGGYSILINPHLKAHRRECLRGYRGQSYALDIVKLNPLGLRARGLWPRELARYEIFGEPVYSPCEGQVLLTENSLPDSTPPEFDRQSPAGNFVYLECGDAGILLAHLMQFSVVVGAGERLHQGQFIGRVGNSGYSTEPHLHIHAQQKKLGADSLSAEPLALRLGGRHLFRNSRVNVE